MSKLQAIIDYYEHRDGPTRPCGPCDSAKAAGTRPGSHLCTL